MNEQIQNFSVEQATPGSNAWEPGRAPEEAKVKPSKEIHNGFTKFTILVILW